MSDKIPLDYRESDIKTFPATKDVNLPPDLRAPRSLGQKGRISSYISRDGDIFTSCVRPNYKLLAAWDSARRKEPVINRGLTITVNSIVAKLGRYIHPDPEIEDFISENLEGKIKRILSELADSLTWSGFTVGENIYKVRKNKYGDRQIWLDDIMVFHPLEPLFKLNANGRLTHGERVQHDRYLTGIWVPCSSKINRSIGPSFSGSHIRLERSKVIHCKMGPGSGVSPYGSSLIESVFKYHIYKELFLDMQATALDRYGSPLIYMKVPYQQTSDDYEEPDGTVRKKYFHEYAEEKLSDLSKHQVLIIPTIPGGESIELGSLTTGNNFSSAFNDAIDLCDDNILMGLGIPNLITKDKNNGLGSSGSAERQVDIYQMHITTIYDNLINSLLQHVIHPLILWNFSIYNKPLAKKPGSFLVRPSLITEMKTYVDVIRLLHETNNLKASDIDVIRDLFRLPYNKPK